MPWAGRWRSILPFDPRKFEGIDNPAHLVRIDILSLIAIGLSYYSADDPTRALEYFQQAEQNPYWPRTDGKEIIYLLLGNAKIRQAALQPSEEALAAGIRLLYRGAVDRSRLRAGKVG